MPSSNSVDNRACLAKYFERKGMPKRQYGESGSHTTSGMSYVQSVPSSSCNVSLRVPLCLIDVLTPCAVPTERLICLNGPTNKDRSVQMAPVAELSMMKSIPSVSQEKESDAVVALVL